MDIVKGSLDDISRPATATHSRPGSRISSSFQVDKAKINSTVGYLEVLTPESGISQWGLKLNSADEQVTPPKLNSEDCHGEKTPENFTGINLERDIDRIRETVKLMCPPKEPDFTELHQSTEEKIDPKLEKAIKRMKALDEILLKRMAKEKEIKVQGLAIRKQLWEKLQHVTLQSSEHSHEEIVNTNIFLALDTQLDVAKANSTVFEKGFLPVFPTQLPAEDCDCDPEALQGNVSGIETSDLLKSSVKSHNRTKQKKNKDHKKGIHFIQRNIELVKDSGSHVLLMDDEKLRLEQLLQDIQDGWTDDDIAVPGECYIPEPGELSELAKIEAELQLFSSTKEPIVTSDCEPGILPKELKQEVSVSKFGNPETAPEEKVLRYTKKLREQKIRLNEIDQQLENIESEKQYYAKFNILL